MNKASQDQHREFTFKMNAYDVNTFPMNRLAEYISDLATVFGEYKHVHFAGLDTGSTTFGIWVEPEAEPKVRSRIGRCLANEGAPEVIRAMRDMNKRLADDNASGVLIDPDGKDIVPFPGESTFSSPVIGPIKQPGAIEGIPIRVGGVGEIVPVHLQGFGNQVYLCEAKREVARQVAKHLFETPLRAEGVGSWLRDADGEWQLRSFIIHGFDEMQTEALSDTVKRLRAVELPLMPGENVLETMSEIRSES